MMSTYALGKMQVRRSGYGAMQLAGPFAFGTPPDRASAVRVLQAAASAGVNHIDTAEYYGPGMVNDLIREALYPYPGDQPVIAGWRSSARSRSAAAPLPSARPPTRTSCARASRTTCAASGSASWRRSTSGCPVTGGWTPVSTTSSPRWRRRAMTG